MPGGETIPRFATDGASEESKSDRLNEQTESENLQSKILLQLRNAAQQVSGLLAD